MKSDVLFKGSNGDEISYEDLIKKIYENSESKQVHLLQTVEILKPMIQKGGVQAAVLLLPHITNLQNVSVKNDEILVKLAAIVSRAIKKGGKDVEDDLESLGLTEEMIRDITKEASKYRPGSSKSDI